MDALEHKLKVLRRWAKIGEMALRSITTASMLAAIGTMAKMRPMAAFTMVKKGFIRFSGQSPAGPVLPPPPQTSPEDMARAQSECNHMHHLTGKPLWDGRGSTRHHKIRTCRACMKRWDWLGDQWVERSQNASSSSAQHYSHSSTASASAPKHTPKAKPKTAPRMSPRDVPVEPEDGIENYIMTDESGGFTPTTEEDDF